MNISKINFNNESNIDFGLIKHIGKEMQKILFIDNII